MSLVSNLISGSTGNFGLINPNKYGHETGALRIATESAEALHDIFIEGFYNQEQIELAAVHEGVSPKSPQYEALIEASVSSVFDKIKEFFKTLWEKVKAFFHGVKRYIDSIFLSGKEFVKKYDADIRKATNLRDFSYKMYKYTNFDNIPDVDVESEANEIIKKASGGKFTDIEAFINAAKDAMDSSADKKKITNDTAKTTGYTIKDENDSDVNKTGEDLHNEIKDVKIDDDVVANTVAVKYSLSNVSEYGDFANACFSHFRDGAEDKSDMEDIEISSISEYANILKSFESSKLSKAMSNTDKAYKKAIKNVDNAEKAANNSMDKGDVKKSVTGALSVYSSAISKAQSLANTYFSAWKSAAKERDSAYKSMIIKAIAYYKKQDKNK